MDCAAVFVDNAFFLYKHSIIFISFILYDIEVLKIHVYTFFCIFYNKYLIYTVQSILIFHKMNYLVFIVVDS